MVSKASEDLPEPETPVTTVSFSTGMVKETFFRLLTRAPRTMMASSLIFKTWPPPTVNSREIGRTANDTLFPGTGEMGRSRASEASARRAAGVWRTAEGCCRLARMMKTLLMAFVLLASCGAALPLQSPKHEAKAPAADARPSSKALDAAQLLEDVRVLSADAMEG